MGSLPTIEFERVKIEDALKEMEQNLGSVTARVIGAEPLPGQQPLAPATVAWIEGLPPSVRPVELVRQFTRIANRLAGLWTDPIECRRFLEGLAAEQGSGRQGFPPEVAREIAALAEHHKREAQYHHAVW